MSDYSLYIIFFPVDNNESNNVSFASIYSYFFQVTEINILVINYITC